MSFDNLWSRDEERGILPAAVDQVLDDRWNRFTVDPVAYLDSRHALEYAEPQAHWVNGCPLGNGDLGVLAYGPPEATMFSFGKTDLWDYTPMPGPNSPDVSFAELREVLAAQDNVRFRDIQARTDEKSTQAVATAKPGGMLRLELFPSALVSRFRQRLSFAHADVTQSWQPIGDRRPGSGGPDQGVRLTSFVHAARNVFVAQAEPGRDLPWRTPVHFSLWRPADADMEAPSCGSDGNRFWVRQELPGGQHFVLMAAVDAADRQVATAGDRITGSVLPHQAALTFYVTLVTSLECSDPLAEARRNLDDALATGFAALHETHRAWWHGYWRRAYVCTPWKKVERAWYQALYLQAGCCRPGRMSPGLQSNLIKENYPAWNADFHNNINMQVLYWGQYTANRLELGEPFYHLFSDVLPRCKQDTAAYFKMRGTRYPIAMGPDGVDTCTGILLSTWIGGGGWLAEHFWWHYRYSGDRAFLEQYAYPLLKECALFYEDYLQEDAEGRLYLFPTIQMEIAVGSTAGAGTNSSWDLPVVIRTFQMALAAAEELGVDAGPCEKWREILSRLPSMPTDASGVWLEFADKGGLWHQWDWARFMAVFPMELVSAQHGPDALRAQAQETVEDYYAYRKAKAREVVHFPGAIQATALLRLGHAERALEMIEFCCDDLSPSGFITGHDAYYVEVDASPGYSIFLSEMLLQSQDGLLQVFPAAPDNPEPVRFHSLRAQGGFLVTAERRENRTQYVIVQSLCGNELRLLNPFPNEPDCGVEAKIYELDTDIRFSTVDEQMKLVPIYNRILVPGEVIELPTEKDRVYLISKEIPWFTNIPVDKVQA